MGGYQARICGALLIGARRDARRVHGLGLKTACADGPATYEGRGNQAADALGLLAGPNGRITGTRPRIRRVAQAASRLKVRIVPIEAPGDDNSSGA